MKIALEGKAQAEMRDAYYDGAPGILVSGIVWATAALMCHMYSDQRGIWTLLIGGVFISPIADFLAKVLGRAGAPPKDNPLTALAIASTVWLIAPWRLAFRFFTRCGFFQQC
jgi:hypothetical protein